jgi:hypothetical protein
MIMYTFACYMMMYTFTCIMIMYTFICFTFKINIIIIHLEYIDISPDSTLIKQHQICLYNTSHINIIN